MPWPEWEWSVGSSAEVLGRELRYEYRQFWSIEWDGDDSESRLVWGEEQVAYQASRIGKSAKSYRHVAELAAEKQIDPREILADLTA